jgi:hypothetical protein
MEPMPFKDIEDGRGGPASGRSFLYQRRNNVYSKEEFSLDEGRDLQRAIFGVIDNQINTNDPPKTRETFDRLVREGHSNTERRKLIGCVIAVELFDIMSREQKAKGSRQ